ncbi:MAG: hypothetical protein ACYDAY_01590 [Candidatus Dormibacteria bacterium]
MRPEARQLDPALPPGGWIIDRLGGIHAFGQGACDNPSDWWTFPIARAIARVPDMPHWGYTLDGYGGVHPFGGAPDIGRVGLSDYWGDISNGGNPTAPNLDIARGLALNPVSLLGCVSGYVLDGYGGVHAFHAATCAAAFPRLHLTDYWGAAPQSNHPDHYNWDIAKGIAVFPDGSGSGYVLDGYGGVHSFWPEGVVAPPGLPPGRGLSDYWGDPSNGGDPTAPNFNIARAITVNPISFRGYVTGYVLDGYGGIHPFQDPGCGCQFPAIQANDYWQGRDVATGITVSDTPGSGYYLDLQGSAHPFAIEGLTLAPEFASGQVQGYPLPDSDAVGIAFSNAPPIAAPLPPPPTEPSPPPPPPLDLEPGASVVSHCGEGSRGNELSVPNGNPINTYYADTQVVHVGESASSTVAVTFRGYSGGQPVVQADGAFLKWTLKDTLGGHAQVSGCTVTWFAPATWPGGSASSEAATMLVSPTTDPNAPPPPSPNPTIQPGETGPSPAGVPGQIQLLYSVPNPGPPPGPPPPCSQTTGQLVITGTGPYSYDQNAILIDGPGTNYNVELAGFNLVNIPVTAGTYSVEIDWAEGFTPSDRMVTVPACGYGKWVVDLGP